MLIITSKREGFRRCSIAFSKVPQSFAEEDFSAAQLQELHSEPMLQVISEEDVTPENPERKSLSRQEILVLACGCLDPEDASNFTNSGLPQVDKLEEIAGVKSVSAAERSEAWKQFQEQ